MRYYKVNNISHTVFESKQEVPDGITYIEDWRDGHIGDWVLADDGCVIQILRKGTMKKPKGKVREIDYIGTCTGTFIVSKKTLFDTSKRVNIYSLGGNIDLKESMLEGDYPEVVKVLEKIVEKLDEIVEKVN